MTSTFIAILLKHGLDADFKVQNDNSVEIQDFLTHEKHSSSYHNIIRARNLYELSFASIPGIIERNVNEHWQLIFKNFVPKEELKSTKFPMGTMLKKLLPTTAPKYRE